MARVGGILIQDKKVLMVLDKNGHYIFPGGKSKHGEKYKDCLKREFYEELSGTEVLVKGFYRRTHGIHPITKKGFYSWLYFCYVNEGIGEPSAEIVGKEFVNSKNMFNLNLTDTARKNLDYLLRDGLID